MKIETAVEIQEAVSDDEWESIKARVLDEIDLSEIQILSRDKEEERRDICGHIGYPFGEPPIMNCNLPLGHSGDHESEYQGRQFKHSEIIKNRQSIGLSREDG